MWEWHQRNCNFIAQNHLLFCFISQNYKRKKQNSTDCCSLLQENMFCTMKVFVCCDKWKSKTVIAFNSQTRQYGGWYNKVYLIAFAFFKNFELPFSFEINNKFQFYSKLCDTRKVNNMTLPCKVNIIDGG